MKICSIFLVAATLLGCTVTEADLSDVQEVACPVSGVERGDQPGQLIEDIEVVTCSGEPISFSQLACASSVTLLDVGAASFRQCVEATDMYVQDPDFRALKARGLQIVQVFYNDADGGPPTTEFCQRYVAAHDIDFQFLIDPHEATSELTQVAPFHLVLDHEGRIRYRWVGFMPPDATDLLSSLLDTSAP